MNSSTLVAGLQQLRGRLALPSRSDQSDEQLLQCFLSRRDDSAFATLVRRHGPMVLQVCRRVLGQEQDAEDAFQATFLVFAQSAASLRNPKGVASFLHGIAYRTALKARQSAARRRKHEGRAPARGSVDPAEQLSWREAQMRLDEEIARLPEMYRSVFVLCCCENLSRAEAGQRLGLSERRVVKRLAKARQRLQQRLSRRGIELTALLAASALTAETASALPAALVSKTIRRSVSPAVAALAAQGLPLVSKVKLALVVTLALVLASGMALAPRMLPQEPSREAPRGANATPLAKRDQENNITIRGCVLDVNGKPAAGVRVYRQRFAENKQKLHETTTAADGRFSLVLPRSDLLVPQTNDLPSHITIVAAAKERGPAWQQLALDNLPSEVTLRLVADDVPIQGRILSLEGKPLAGVQVRLHSIEAFPKVEFSRVLQAWQKGNPYGELRDIQSLWLPDADPQHTTTTDAEGRFRLNGVGRERLATLYLTGPRIQYSSFRVMTSIGSAVHDPSGNVTIRPATFEYPARPSRLIRGTVREEATGKPLAGVRVSGFETTAQVRTDAQGRFELPGCPKAKHYGLLAYPPQDLPYFAGSIEVQDTEGLGPLTADLELVRGILVEGKVVESETGKPVEGGISYYPLAPNPNVMRKRGQVGTGAASALGPHSHASVAADGSFRCLVLPGPGCLALQAKNARRNRYQSACVDPATIKAYGGNKDTLLIPFQGDSVVGTPQEQFQAIELLNPAKDTKRIETTIRVELAPEIKGTVVDPEGKPLTGVNVRGLESSYSRTTLATEQFTIHSVNPQRPRRLSFVHEERRLIGRVEVKGTETKPLTVQLQPWVTVRGRLLDAEGRPLRNVALYASPALLEEGRTDSDGRFCIERLIPGARYELSYSKDKPRMHGTVLKAFVGKAGETHDAGDVRGRPIRTE